MTENLLISNRKFYPTQIDQKTEILIPPSTHLPQNFLRRLDCSPATETPKREELEDILQEDESVKTEMDQIPDSFSTSVTTTNHFLTRKKDNPISKLTSLEPLLVIGKTEVVVNSAHHLQHNLHPLTLNVHRAHHDSLQSSLPGKNGFGAEFDVPPEAPLELEEVPAPSPPPPLPVPAPVESEAKASVCADLFSGKYLARERVKGKE